MERFQILFVCAGNICRSPLAEGIFRHIATNAGRAAEFNISSAGTGGWHHGDEPDHRYFDRFDLILTMDHENLRDLLKIAPGEAIEKIHLFNGYVTGTDEDIPDPYYGDREDFERVYTMLFAGCSSLLATAGKALAS